MIYIFYKIWIFSRLILNFKETIKYFPVQKPYLQKHCNFRMQNIKTSYSSFYYFFVTSVVYFQWYIQVNMCLMRQSIVRNITKIGWNFCLHLLKHVEILWTIWMQIYCTCRKKSNSFYHVYDSKIEHETSIFRKRQCMMFKC